MNEPLQLQPSPSPALIFAPFLTDEELADLLVLTREWVRSHATSIPGFERLGSYYRFRRTAVENWLEGLTRLFEAEDISAMLNVPQSWVYANADEIPGVIRLGRYVRFRPAIIHRFLSGSEVVQ